MDDHKIDQSDIDRPKTQAVTPHSDNISMSTMQISRKVLFGEMTTRSRAHVEIIGLPEGTVEFSLKDEEVLIGRSGDCQLTLPAVGISRHHARIRFINEEYRIEDLNSTNGTFVNNIKIVKCILRNLDCIEIGNIKLVFVEERIRTR